jgi:hypothetical protein
MKWGGGGYFPLEFVVGLFPAGNKEAILSNAYSSLASFSAMSLQHLHFESIEGCSWGSAQGCGFRLTDCLGCSPTLRHVSSLGTSALVVVLGGKSVAFYFLGAKF